MYKKIYIILCNKLTYRNIVAMDGIIALPRAPSPLGPQGHLGGRNAPLALGRRPFAGVTHFILSPFINLSVPFFSDIFPVRFFLMLKSYSSSEHSFIKSGTYGEIFSKSY